MEPETILLPGKLELPLDKDTLPCHPVLHLCLEDYCLDLEEVDEELSDLEAETHAVEDRGAREESRGEASA